MTKTYALFAVLGCFGLMGCDQGVDGDGNRLDKVRPVAEFTRIRNDTELDVQVTQADWQSTIVSIDHNLNDLVETYVHDDTLYIELKDDIGKRLGGPHVLITTPQLSAAKLDGSGNLIVALDQPSAPLDLYLSGSGSMRFEGTTAAIGAYVSGSGDLLLEGQTSDVDMSLDGSGDIRGQHLTADSASIHASGSGDVSANASESVTVSLSGSGDVDLYGEATLDDYHNSGSGDLHQH